jgi:sulfur carrier protein
MILLNGSESELRAGETVASVLIGLDLSPQAPGVAVAVNGEVVPRTSWGTFKLPAEARVEVLVAMQGG